jgi:anti-anti-sigma factor
MTDGDPAMELSIVEATETHTHVALRGNLDIQGTVEVDVWFSALTAGRGKPTLVDLSRVEFLSSLGMGMLVACARALQAKGASMVLVDPPRAVEKALVAAALHRVFPIVHGIEAARARLEPESPRRPVLHGEATVRSR